MPSVSGAQTFVIEHEGRFYESLVTYYPKIAGLGITMGSECVEPHDLVEAKRKIALFPCSIRLNALEFPQ